MNICTRTCKSVYVSYVYQETVCRYPCINACMCVVYMYKHMYMYVHVYDMQEMHRQIFTLCLLMIAVASEHHAKMSNRYLHERNTLWEGHLTHSNQDNPDWMILIHTADERTPACPTNNKSHYIYMVYTSQMLKFSRTSTSLTVCKTSSMVTTRPGNLA